LIAAASGISALRQPKFFAKRRSRAHGSDFAADTEAIAWCATGMLGPQATIDERMLD
jgi:hypothetical protein